MAYTPELNMEYSGILRRIAWAYTVPMTKALEGILELAARYMDSERVCEACRDNSFCDSCIFSQETK
jgi:hypothetical protein